MCAVARASTQSVPTKRLRLSPPARFQSVDRTDCAHGAVQLKHAIKRTAGKIKAWLRTGCWFQFYSFYLVSRVLSLATEPTVEAVGIHCDAVQHRRRHGTLLEIVSGVLCVYKLLNEIF